MWNERTVLMYGEEAVARLAAARVLVVGCGGVGGYVAEMLARAGVGHLTLVDADTVNDSNRNRQIIAMRSTVGKKKVEVLAERLKDVNDDLSITIVPEYVKDERITDILDGDRFDFVVDAIDTLAPKVFLLYEAHKRAIPTVSSMGSGGKSDPTQVRISDIDKSNYCKLARMVRKRLHKLGVRKGIEVVYSAEVVPAERVIITEGEENKKSNVGTVSYMPAVFGCFMASYLLKELIKSPLA